MKFSNMKFISKLIERMVWHSGATIIGYVTLLHLCWAVIVMFSWSAVGTTPLATLAKVLGYDWLLSFILLSAAVMATIGGIAPRRIFGLALMLPQQTILIIASFGAISAVLNGSYPDGTIRWGTFILADQLAIILLAPSYTVGILTFHGVIPRRD